LPKILLIRFSSIGDIVLTSPVIRALATQLPGAEIHYLTKPQYAEILRHDPHIHQLHLLDKPLLQKAWEIRQIGFDHVIDLHNNLRSAVVRAVVDAGSSVFKKASLEKTLFVKLKTDALPRVHVVDRYMDTVSHLGVLNDGAGLHFYLAPDAEESLQTLGLPRRYIAFAIGAQHATKRLPTDKITEICQRLETVVVLLGGKEDAERGALIASAAGSHVINLCGKLSLQQSAAVVKACEKLITHDTGLMHIGAAFRKPVISVWGNTIPGFGMYPYYGDQPVPSWISEVNNLYCRPCSRIGYSQCPLGHFRCMKEQDTQAIASLAERA
jgi:ADP-heptose:LPS heptosyltransferase